MVATRYRNFNSDSLLYFWVACCYHRYHHGYPLDTTEQPRTRSWRPGRRPPGRTGRRQPQVPGPDPPGLPGQARQEPAPRRRRPGRQDLAGAGPARQLDGPASPRPLARAGDDELGASRGSPGRAAAVLQPCAAGRAGPRQRPDFPRYRRRDGQWSGAARSARRDPELERQPGMAAKNVRGFRPRRTCASSRVSATRCAPCSIPAIP